MSSDSSIDGTYNGSTVEDFATIERIREESWRSRFQRLNVAGANAPPGPPEDSDIGDVTALDAAITAVFDGNYDITEQMREEPWRYDVNLMRTLLTERGHGRVRLLEESREEWNNNYADLQRTARAAHQQVRDQDSIIETLTERLRTNERAASEEATELRDEHTTVKDQLLRAESAERLTERAAKDALAEAEAARQQNRSLWV